MLRSMTGYGRGECVRHDRKITAEIKSVNHRFNDLNIKMPRLMNCFEDKLRKRVAGQVLRGKTDLYIGMESFAKDDVKINVNFSLAQTYAEALSNLKKELNLDGNVTVQMVAGFGDVISVEKNQNDEQVLAEIWECAEAALDAALGQFIRMREAEGEALKADVLQKAQTIAAHIEKLNKRVPFVLEDYAARLKQRVVELLQNAAVDESRLLTEVAIFADRACVDEEMTRLASHVAQLKSILNEEEAVGRKLDFLIQEMNREVNTIGSKANDLELTSIVVELKSEVEKIREQAQNIE